MWCDISGGAAREIWNWSLLGVKGLKSSRKPPLQWKLLSRNWLGGDYSCMVQCMDIASLCSNTCSFPRVGMREIKTFFQRGNIKVSNNKLKEIIQVHASDVIQQSYLLCDSIVTTRFPEKISMIGFMCQFVTWHKLFHFNRNPVWSTTGRKSIRNYGDMCLGGRCYQRLWARIPTRTLM